MSSISAQAHFILGLRTGVSNNLNFIDEHTLVYATGSSCVCLNTVQRFQRFFPGSEKSRSVRALAVSASHRFLAVSECGESACITVFDLQHEQGRKKKVLSAGDIHAQEFVCIAFSHDSKYLIGQTGAPEWMLVFWLWEKNKVLASVKTTTSSNPVNQVSFSPHNSTQLCVSGSGVFKLLRLSEGVLKQTSTARVENFNFLCHAWVPEDRLIAGTDTGRLLVSESGDIRKEIRMMSKEGQSQADRQVKVMRLKEAEVVESLSACPITAVFSYSKGFVCSTGPGTACLFEKMEQDSYRRSREIQIPPDPQGDQLTLADGQEIQSMCMSPAEETLAISTTRGQLFSVNVSSADMNKEQKLHFDFVCQPFHSSPITGLSICFRKPLVATCSLDRSVHIWNYETKELDLYKQFQEEAHSVALHPTGFFVLVGFSDKLRLMNLLVDDIRVFQEFTVRSCRECAFSHGGHMFAAVSGNMIHVYSFISCENVLNLKGHSGKVRSIEWSVDDSRLVSCGMDGAVYEWNTQTGKRESESVLESCSFTGVAFSLDYKSALAVGSDLTLKEVQDGQVLRVVPADQDAHTAIAVSHSGRVVFTGTSSGAIRAIKYPLPSQRDWFQQRAHSGAITKMVITYDDQFLLSVAEDNCLLVSKIIDKDGRGLKSNRQVVHAEEILVTKLELEEKNQSMMALKMRLEELQMEHEYRLRLKDVNYNEKIKELSEKFQQEIKSLKTTQQVMTVEVETCKRESEKNSAELAKKHVKQLKDLERSFNQKLILEHEKFQDLQEKLKKTEEDHKKQLRSAEQSKVQALEEATHMYEAKLQEKTQLLAQSQQEAQLKISVLNEVIKQMEEDEELKLNAVQIKYEKKLQSEKEINLNLKGKTDDVKHEIRCLQAQVRDQSADTHKLQQERQSLRDLITALEGDIQELNMQIFGHKQTIENKDITISDLKGKIQQLEKLKFIYEFQLNEFRKQTETQKEEIKEQREMITTLKDDLQQMDKSSSQLKLSNSDLRLKLKAKDKEIFKNLQKVKNLELRLTRIRSDLHTCVGYIQEPRKLKESIKILYAHHVPEPGSVERDSEDVEEEEDEDDVQMTLTVQRDQLEKTVDSLKMKLDNSDAEHNKVYERMKKEKAAMITENNQLRKELLLIRTQVKDYRNELAWLKWSKNSRPQEHGRTEADMQKSTKRSQQSGSTTAVLPKLDLQRSQLTLK
ncbi:cilia- and flagella-associated protein 57 [Oryzias latipes]|uniref:Cilia and flagella associated protein 57 n=1 Tax=Oryzias latipes TaxID=8090 RepID=A0A3B3HXP3_ORYLA|nr:cilia- and flagella-associated protein 57 [Oryzias latipes]